MRGTGQPRYQAADSSLAGDTVFCRQVKRRDQAGKGTGAIRNNSLDADIDLQSMAKAWQILSIDRDNGRISKSD